MQFDSAAGTIEIEAVDGGRSVKVTVYDSRGKNTRTAGVVLTPEMVRDIGNALQSCAAGNGLMYPIGGAY